MIGRTLYRRTVGGVSPSGVAYTVDILTVDLYRPQRYAWVFGGSIEIEGHPSEAQVSITVLWWRLVVWWQR